LTQLIGYLYPLHASGGLLDSTRSLCMSREDAYTQLIISISWMQQEPLT